MSKRKKLRTSGIWTFKLTPLLAASAYRRKVDLLQKCLDDHTKLLKITAMTSHMQ